MSSELKGHLRYSLQLSHAVLLLLAPILLSFSITVIRMPKVLRGTHLGFRGSQEVGVGAEFCCSDHNIAAACSTSLNITCYREEKEAEASNRNCLHT